LPAHRKTCGRLDGDVPRKRGDKPMTRPCNILVRIERERKASTGMVLNGPRRSSHLFVVEKEDMPKVVRELCRYLHRHPKLVVQGYDVQIGLRVSARRALAGIRACAPIGREIARRK